MSSVIFQSAQRIIAQIFEWLQTSGQSKTSNFITDAFQTGVVPLELGEFSVAPGSNNTSITPTITVGSGVAYGLDSSRILIATGDVTPYNAAAPSTTTNDGLGNLISTPQSTGCVNIPLTQSSQNYVWIQYLATIDTTAFTLNKETNAKQFYKQTDGYQITVTTTNVSPGANYLYLANVNMLGGGAVTSSVIFITGRTYFQITETVVPITTPQAGTNPPDRTPVYAPSSTYTLEAHIKAVGTGTGLSPTNPHNMSLTDLGVSALDTVQEHRLLEHGGGGSTSVAANAIIAGTPGTPYPTTSAMAQSINIVNPGSDTLNIYTLSASEFAIVNGSAFNANNIFGAVPTNATVMFPATSGTYDVYWDSVAKVFGVTTGDISTDITKLWLATVTYTVNFTPGYNHLSGLIDRRRIGSTTHLLQRWFNNSRPGAGSALNPQSGEFGFNLNNTAPEYYDGTQWQGMAVPTATVLPFAGSVAPSGFLLANGASVSTATFANLFAVIGYTYGGAGASFNLPNLVNNIPVGVGGSIAPTLGSTAGATTETPTENPHQHSGVAGSNAGTGYIPAGTGWTHGYTTETQEVASFTATAGSGTLSFGNTGFATPTINPVSIVQPSIGLNYIIKT